MRAGICSIQLQSLTPEAASVVKQAVNLSTRRGHAQVTPLHVASAMLSASSGLLRRACLQCHSHPLQCKALELCFNVALNRLPASTPNPLLGPHYTSNPSLSNALVAAFKRAQSHQRRGSIETQQNQPILALKIEIEQLIISILDDPSVSRVMREAGFSSTMVKTRVEQAVSIELPNSNPNPPKPHNILSVSPSDQIGGSFKKPIDLIDDVSSVVGELVNRRRNLVLVGESLASAEGLARGVKERLERGGNVQFVSLPLVSFRNIGKEEVEHKLLELRCLVKSYVGKGVVLYLGDLKWLIEFWSSFCSEKRGNFYCSLEQMVMEVKKLVSGRLWLMGISTFKTYMKCKTCHPSLETLWELHPFTIPVRGLSLSLNFDSDFQSEERSKVIMFKEGCFDEDQGGRVKKNLTCCKDCSLNFEREARSITSSMTKKECSTTIAISSNPSLPLWLQNCKEEGRSYTMDDEENGELKDLCKKWNSFCSSVHRHTSILGKPLLLPSSSPLSSPSWPLIISEPKPKECDLYTETGDRNEDDDNNNCYESNLIMFMPDHRNVVAKPDLLWNPNSSPNSASSSEAMDGLDSTQMFKELNDENLKILCDALEKKVPLEHKETVPEVAKTVLYCRSGMRKREKKEENNNQETWMVFLGVDCHEAKENISRELAKAVFGSYINFVSIGISSFGSRIEEFGNKRARDEMGRSYLERFGEAVNENPHRVFFMEDLEQVDWFSQKGIKQAIESGSLRLPESSEEVPLKDAIVIFSSESSYSSGREKKKKNKHDGKLEDKSEGLSLDLNIAIEDDGDCGILELVDKHIFFKDRKIREAN